MSKKKTQMRNSRDYTGLICNLAICGLVVVGVVSAFLLVVKPGIKMAKEEKQVRNTVITKTYKVRSLKSATKKNAKIYGSYSSFVMGFGSVYGKQEEESYYVAFVEQDNGGYKLKRYSTDDTSLFFDVKDNDSAYLKVTTDGYGNLRAPSELHVPEDTVKEEFDVNDIK
jgi:hypothetical protein